MAMKLNNVLLSFNETAFIYYIVEKRWASWFYFFFGAIAKSHAYVQKNH